VVLIAVIAVAALASVSVTHGSSEVMRTSILLLGTCIARKGASALERKIRTDCALALTPLLSP
jgi:UDP-N-acetylglucosamine enolpyruvyl transferase